jgi:hypothetical protein
MSGEKLPEDVLPTILAALEVPDLLRAGCVCSSWRRACDSLRHERELGARIRPQTPCLLYTNASSGDSAAGLYSLAEEKPYTLALPDPPIRSCYLIGSAYGWIVTVDRRSELHLLNPITGDQIDLPSATTIEQVRPLRDCHGAVRLYEYSWSTATLTEGSTPSVFRLHKLRDYVFQKAFLSSDPSTGAYTVVLIHNPYWQLSFARAGDDHWTWLPDGVMYADCVFKDDGLLYAMRVDGGIHAYDPSDPALKPRVVMDGFKVGPGGIYIVQAPCGDLLQIHRDLEYPDEEDKEVPGDEPDLDPPDDDEYFSEPDRATSEDDAEPAWWSVSEDGAEPELDSMPLHEKVVFKVYRVDLTAKKFVEVSSLGDNVLFLGLNQSLCLCAKEYPELKGNHIYFTDDGECMAFESMKT